MLCSIFIASTTQTSCPDSTRSPGRTVIDITLPGMGERMVESDWGWAAAALGAEGGEVADWDWVLPRRGRLGDC